jgi:hypothetical protein
MACAPLGGTAAIDVATRRATVSGQCTGGCNIGPPLPSLRPSSATGGGGRASRVQASLFSCIHLSRLDADCGSKAIRLGLWVDTDSFGKTVQRCVVSGMAGQLAVVSVSPSKRLVAAAPCGICTALCRLGSPKLAGSGSLRSTPARRWVATSPRATPFTPAISGCLQLCEGNDCSYRAANWVCRTDIRIMELGNHAVCPVPPARLTVRPRVHSSSEQQSAGSSGALLFVRPKAERPASSV